jgi:hypothetical protein
MKDEEGKGWAEIKDAWEAITGDKVGNTNMLRMRYSRIKSNFTVIPEDDVSRTSSNTHPV